MFYSRNREQFIYLQTYKLIKQYFSNRMKQSNKFFMFTLCFIAFTSQISKSICPQICKCDTISKQCQLCLEKQFNRNYVTENKTCACLPYYRENYPPTDACCAQNCSSCYKQGCYQCRKNWTKTLSQDQYICTCKKNYEYDISIDDCVCLFDKDTINQLKFYTPSRLQCYACPKGCSCNSNGCYTCGDTTNREIKLTIYNVWSCFCKNDYKEDQNQFCVSKNQLVHTCPINRIRVNNSCVCTEPYYQILGQCLCKSYINQKLYYMYRGICYPCPALCKCNKYGCVRCSSSAHRYIYENNCSCNLKSIQIHGECICISPYDSSCNCNTKYIQYTSLFYQQNNTSRCLKCPNGCICNQTTCISCNSSTQRNSSCQCLSPFIQLDGECIGCLDNFIYVNKTCICPTSFNLQLFYDQQTKNCKKCPIGCSCNQNGCYQCSLPLNRIIISNSYNKFTCYCNFNKRFYQNSLGICECRYPCSYDSINNNCSCKQPYFQDDKGNCICKSFKNQTEYYNPQSGCKPCPIQCNCSTIGCYQCSTKTGRVIIREHPESLILICPCFPIEINQTNGYCTLCPSNQYIWKNQCINCDSSCMTCDQYGCLTCISSMELLNHTCFCTNNQTFDGFKCLCGEGSFADIITQECSSCPLNCVNCQLNIDLSGMIECIECNTSLFRQNDTANNCPCIDNYVQGIFTYPYCCHWSCQDCNISGCTSCLPFTFRYLNYSDPSNITCSCKTGFIQNYYVICQCALGTYLYINKCLPCPGYCLECIRINSLINCIVCAPGLNRKIFIAATTYLNNKPINIYDCVCQQNFFFYSDSLQCYPKGCIGLDQYGICNKCEADRNWTGSTCNCQLGKYEDSYGNCLLCSEGCIQCISYEICNSCDNKINYYLVLNQKTMIMNCIKPLQNKRILFHNHNNNNHRLQFILNSELNTIQMYIISIISKNATKLDVFRFIRNKQNVSLIEFNIYQDQVRQFLLYINSSDNDYQTYFLMRGSLYTNLKLTNSYLQDIFIIIFIGFIMIISFILALLGEKSNQLIYYYQTIYFVSMNIKDSFMKMIPFLNSLHIITFNFTFDDSQSPFNSLIDNWNLFIEHTQGNYRYFSMDNNLIRNAGLAFYLNIQTIIFSIALRIVYYFLYRSKYKPFVKKYKKVVYRSIQWMYKITMYPFIFYSVSTIINYNSQYSLVDQQFRQLNFNLSIIILVCYAVITVLYIIFQDISKLHRYDIAIQYIFNMIDSVIIVYSVYNRFIFVLILSILLKRFLNSYIYKSYMRNISSFYKYTNLLSLIQCLVITPIYFCSKLGTIILLLCYTFGVITLRITLIWKTHMYYKFEKKTVFQQENKESKKEQNFVSNAIFTQYILESGKVIIDES